MGRGVSSGAVLYGFSLVCTSGRKGGRRASAAPAIGLCAALAGHATALEHSPAQIGGGAGRVLSIRL